MFISSPSHGFAHRLLGHFLFVWPSVFVSRHVSRSVDYVLSSCLALPAAGGVEALLVRPRELGGVREAADCWGSHCSLEGHLGFGCFNTTFQFYPAVTRWCTFGDVRQAYRDSWNDRRLPLYQLEDLGLGLVSALLLVLLPGQLRQRHLELLVRDVATGFLPKMRVEREVNQECKHLRLVSAGLRREALKLKMYTQTWDRVNAGDVRQQGNKEKTGRPLELVY